MVEPAFLNVHALPETLSRDTTLQESIDFITRFRNVLCCLFKRGKTGGFLFGFGFKQVPILIFIHQTMPLKTLTKIENSLLMGFRIAITYAAL